MSDNSLDFIAGSAQTIAAKRMAEALTVGFECCAGERRALTQLQQTDVIRSALMSFDGFRAEFLDSLRVDKTLRDLAGLGE